MSVDELKRRAQDGETTEELAASAAALLSGGADTALFDDDAQLMAVRLADGLVIHGGESAGDTRMRAARHLAALLLALRGDGVHLITPDDESAHAEGAAAQAVLGPLTVNVGVLQAQMSPAQQRPAYAADITVGAISRFALDALHDSQATRAADRVYRNAPAAVVTDTGQAMITHINGQSVLMEKDRTPSEQLRHIAAFASKLREGADFTANPETGVPRITPLGREKLHDAFGVADPAGMQALLLQKRLSEAVLARRSRRGQDYEVVDATVVRVPEGPLPDGYTFTGGLRQALEVKEGLPVTDTDWLTATTTIPAHLRRYRIVGGTSVAKILFRAEMEEIFGLEVWDRRTPQEIEVERVHAADIARYLEINRNLARWDVVAARHRAEFHDLRERAWNPSELIPAVQHLTGEAVSTPTDELRTALQAGVDQALVYYNVADAYGRSIHWPDALADHEQVLTGIRNSLWEDLRSALSRQTEHQAPPRV